MCVIQVNSDWRKRGKQAEILPELGDLEYKGPGLYFTDQKTLLVIPDTDVGSGLWQNIWSEDQRDLWPGDQIYWVYCWQCRVENTILYQKLFPIHTPGNFKPDDVPKTQKKSHGAQVKTKDLYGDLPLSW